jgi:hypothetical protein
MATRSPRNKVLATVDDDGNIIESAAPVVEQPELSDFSEGSPDVALETALMQIGQDTENCARVIIYRIIKEAGKSVEEWLHETNPADFSEGGLAGIAREWGAGTYRVRIFIPGENGFRSNKVIRLAAPKETGIQAAQAAQSAGITELAGVMMSGFQKLGEMIAVGQQKPAATEEDMLRKMAMYKELFAPAHQAMPAANPLDSMTTMMEMFKQGMELGRMGGGEPSSMDALMKGLEVFGPIAQQIAAKQEPAPTAAHNQNQHAAGAALLAQPASPLHSNPSEQPDMNVRAMMLKQALSFLISQAKKGADPYTYANVVMDQLDDDELSSLINRPDWLDWLASVNPDVKAPEVSPWFVKLHEEIVSLLTEPPEESISNAHATSEPAIEAETIPAADKSAGGNS